MIMCKSIEELIGYIKKNVLKEGDVIGFTLTNGNEFRVSGFSLNGSLEYTVAVCGYGKESKYYHCITIEDLEDFLMEEANCDDAYYPFEITEDGEEEYDKENEPVYAVERIMNDVTKQLSNKGDEISYANEIGDGFKIRLVDISDRNTYLILSESSIIEATGYDTLKDLVKRLTPDYSGILSMEAALG